MSRRALLQTGLLLAGALLVLGHTPYGQWVVYRKKHLLIGCHKEDPRTYDLAQQIVAILGQELPAASARVARAPDAGRLASLLGSDQLEVAVIDRSDAAAMLGGSDGFAAYGAIELRLIVPLIGRLMVAHAGFPDRHAWLVTAALAATEVAAPLPPAGEAEPPWHPGSLAFLEGRPQPTADPE